MIVSRARVQYFRSIVDTDWVELQSDITTLLGKNESGKSSFLKALEAVSHEEPFNERDQNYNQSPDETPFEMVRVELILEGDTDSIEVGPLEFDEPIHVVKLSNGDRRVESSSGEEMISRSAQKRALRENVEEAWQVLNNLRNQNTGNFRKRYDQNVQQNIKNIKNSGENNSLQWNLNQLENAISGLDTLPEIDTEESTRSIEDIKIDLQDTYSEAEAVSNFDVSSVLPSVVYHDEFDRITDTANINSLDQPENRTFRNLLKLAEIDYEDFDNKEDLAQMRELQTAGTDVSGEVNSIWDQKSVDVSITNRKNKFMVQIADSSLKGGKSGEDVQRDLVPPSSRSEGFQWFFSFYTNLSAETDEGDENKLILLDDPAVVLHPEGKKNWLDAIEQMADNAQFVYSSHSPFLIRKEHPERIRLVEDLPGQGTKITRDWAEGDSMALKPLRNALGIGLGDSPFASKRQILVEGVTDYYIFTALNNYLKSVGMNFIDSDEVSVMPTNGAPNMPNAAKWVASEEFSYVILLDNDQAGKDAKEEIIEQHQEVDPERIVLLELDDERPEFRIELEDLFSTEFYVESVNRAYSEKFAGEFSEISLEHDESENIYHLNEVEYKGRKITSKLEEVLSNQGMGEFDKVLVANEVQDRLNSGDVDKSDITAFLPIFDKIRKLT